MSWPARMAFSIAGITRLLVADDARRTRACRPPGGSTRLARISSLTVRERQPDVAQLAEGGGEAGGGTWRSSGPRRDSGDDGMARKASVARVRRAVKRRLGRRLGARQARGATPTRGATAASRACSRSSSTGRRPTRSASSGRTPQAKWSNESPAMFQVARTAGGRRWTWPCWSRASGPDVVRGEDAGPTPDLAHRQHDPEPRPLVLVGLDGWPWSRPSTPSRSGASMPGDEPVAQGERPDHEPRPLAAGRPARCPRGRARR